MMLAERLVNELMLVSVLVAGDADGGLVTALAEAGAAAEALGDGVPPDGFDLAILLAAPGAAGLAATRATVDRLSRASERLLLAPLPLGVAASADAPALPELPQWFELFAELGYQPVIEFDAGFVSAGAFLVDRAATAAEGDLAAFTDRLQLGPDAARQQREAVADAERSVRSELQAARAGMDAREAEIAALREAAAAREAALADALAHVARLEAAVQAAEAALHETEARNAGWEGLRRWVRLDVAVAPRDELAGLARDLPALNDLRAPGLPPVLLPASIRPGWWKRMRRRAATTERPAVLEDAALVRVSPLFDAAWYIASHPALWDKAALDPALHYVLVGGLQGADPGPWFDSAAYVAGHPGLERTPLADAIRRGEVGDAAPE